MLPSTFVYGNEADVTDIAAQVRKPPLKSFVWKHYSGKDAGVFHLYNGFVLQALGKLCNFLRYTAVQ